MLEEWGGRALLLGAGFVAGALNVIAGGGSFLTLPLLIFLGLPATLANGTNRVAILLQNAGAVWSFHRYGVLDTRSLTWAALPATLGAVFGTWLALAVSDASFQRILALLMVVISVASLWSPPRHGQTSDTPRYHLLATVFFLVGIYGGFVQAGVGFLILAATTWAGLDLIRGNAVKVLSILSFTGLSLAIFAWQGKVDWTVGVWLGVGTALGGLAGARLTVLKGDRWIRRIVTVAIFVFAVKLWLAA